MRTDSSTGDDLRAAIAGRHHRPALVAFVAVVLAHWAEHVAQALQIYLLGWPVKDANGLLGLVWPWLVTSEWMHYGYAVAMMVGLILLRPGFAGRSHSWWSAATGLQIWHHFEHLLLLVQALTGAHLLGAAVPTSIAQLVLPRVELHLFYNTVVTIPMVVGMVAHMRARPEEHAATCSCADRRVAEPV